MGRRRQITDPRPAISLKGETGLHQLPLIKIAEYGRSRDLTLFGDMDELEALAEPLTIYWMRPLEARFRRWRKADDPDSLWAIFAHHLDRVTEAGKKVVYKVDKDGEVDESCRGPEFSEEVVEEMAIFCQEMDSRDGDLLPFSLPDTWREEISRARLRATTLERDARTSDTVKE